jgi:pimeloyl-ACP methyl ester carboxylesterase
MEPEEIAMMAYAAIAYPDVCEMWKYETPIKYERYKFRDLDIWRHSKNSRTVVITLSGGCRLEFCQYIQKLVDGLDLDADIYGIDNFNTFNFCCIGDIADFIRSIDYDELIVMGFSMGGVLGSQVLAQLNAGWNQRCREPHESRGVAGVATSSQRQHSWQRPPPATLVVIGTPFNINNSTDLFDNHMQLYRIDFSHLYYKAFRNSLNHNRGTLPSDVLTLGKYDGYARFIERIYALPNFRFLMKINPNIPNCRVLSFYNNLDLLVHRELNIPDIELLKSELDASSTFEEYAFETWVPGHNSEWAQEANRKIICQQMQHVLDKKM